MTDHLFSDMTGNNILSLLEQQEHATTADDRGLFVKYYNYDATLAPGDVHPAEEDKSVPIWCMFGLIVIVIFLFRGVCMGPPAPILPVVGVVIHEEEEHDTPPKPKKKREDPEIRRKRILKAFDVNQVTLVRIETYLRTTHQQKQQQQNVHC
jgi:hypothetical protein